MKCFRCNVDMIIGQAIDYPNEKARSACTSFGPRNITEVNLIKCWKCPKCGESEDLES